MKQNKYDDAHFFAAYEKMPRSLNGLEGSGEWPLLKKLLPELKNKRVLDLGCGFGWHCRYARMEQAHSAVGIDISEKMLQRARELTDDPHIAYRQIPMEDIHFAADSFDVVFSSLAFHYVRAFKAICIKVHDCLTSGGKFVFSVEHPVFTARAEQDWWYDEQGNRLHWPIDHYQHEGIRHTPFLTEDVIKYHRTLATYINTLVDAGFTIKTVEENFATEEMIQKNPAMFDENRRPMFLLISAEKMM
ncbi:class I SAM-dependent methyltransferase [Oceanobacillus sp. FSL K6-2867]|uniref:class I SAM-dependent methyltransferase n=1 Tax=Oceanobacillus sp. FSL K6-2867 TaxID=2954748 RepID=UPI0030DC68E1